MELKMDTKAELKELYNKKLHSFFESEFAGKNITTAIDTTFKESIVKLLKTQINFALLLDCLNAIKCNENIFKKFSNQTRKKIYKKIKELEFICISIDNILKDINNFLESKN